LANEKFIHVPNKKSSGRYGTSQFFKEIDKGSAKPAFCYPRRTQALKEEHASMKRNLDRDMVSPERRMAYEQKMNQLGKRVGEIDASFEAAKEIIEKSKDGWKTRRDNLAQKIADQTPTRDDERKKKVNPHAILRREKQGERGEEPLEKSKRDYTIISRAFQASGEYEEANHSFLQRDK
jgi:hypothetical protein